MSRTLTDVILDDLEPVYFTAKQITKGALQGTYTPYFLNTCIKQMIEDGDGKNLTFSEQLSYKGDIMDLKTGIQGISAISTQIYLTGLAIEEGLTWYHIAALVGCNLFDYLKNAHKRSKE